MSEFLQIIQKSGKILFFTSIVFSVFAVGIMVSNLYKTSKRLESSLPNIKYITSAQPIVRKKYEDLIIDFKESYVSPTVHKRNIFMHPREVIEGPVEEPVITVTEFKDMKERLRVRRIYKKPVKLLFKGYLQMGDGTYVATINWGGKTDFKKVGDVIRGYKVVDFKKTVSEQKTPWGGTEKIDQSTITLERETGEKFALEIGKIALENEIYAEIWDRKEAKSYEIYIGYGFLDNKVLDITAEKVTIKTPKGEEFVLIKEGE
jgi:hypothetical protein